MTYEGITNDTLFLLAENRFHDSKRFYEEHKPALWQGAVEPLRHLCADLTPVLGTIDPRIVTDPMKNGCVSRIRRDSRFTHDKSMYRENLWVAFMRDKAAYNWCVPAFYLDFSVRHADWGLGFYSATPEIMRLLRRLADNDRANVQNAVLQAQKAGFTLCGTPYARPRHPEDAPEDLWPLYDCKNIELLRRETPAFVADPGLPEVLAAGFVAMAPFYDILMKAVEIAAGEG